MGRDPVGWAYVGKETEEEASGSLLYKWDDSIPRKMCCREGVEHESARMGAWYPLNFLEVEQSACSPHQQKLLVKRDYLVAEKRSAYLCSLVILGKPSFLGLDSQKLLGFHSSSEQSAQKKHQVC